VPVFKNLTSPADVIYVYDGGLDGLLCCVHESVYSGEFPFGIVTFEDAQLTLMPQKVIETDADKAQKVKASIVNSLSSRVMELTRNVFMSCLENRELAILKFLLLAYGEGPKAAEMLSHPDVSVVLKAERHLLGEQHLLLGFIRFADYGGKLAATITPKNFILPYLVKHFTMRYSEEEFMIYDKAHGAALIYADRKAQIIPLDSVTFDEEDETEKMYQALWKQFYNTIAIKERYNPKCRMTHLPKRYWENMLEMKELL